MTITTVEKTKAPAIRLAVDIGGTKISAALVTDENEILHRTRFATPAVDAVPADALTQFITPIAELVRSTGTAVSSHSCVIVRPGITSGEKVALSPNVPTWGDADLVNVLDEVLGIRQIQLHNDVKAAAYAELREGRLKEIDPGLYINLGTGIAAAVTVNGRVLEGAHRAAGEIAYMSLHPGLLAGARPHADIAPLEQRIGGTALDRLAGELFPHNPLSQALFSSEEPAGTIATHEVAALLSMVLANICTLIDPARIVFGGGITASFDILEPLVRTHLERSVPFVPELVMSAFPTDASLRGAILLHEADS